MTARTPLYVNGSNDLQEMTAAEIVEIQERMIYYYGQSPSVTLAVDTGSAQNLDAISDTRQQAGSTSQSSTAFVAESSTAEPSTVTVSYDRVGMTQTTSGHSQPSTNTSFPVYYDSGSGSIIAMTEADMKDTFVKPAIDLLVSGTESANTAGTYTITTSATAASNYTAVSSDAVFVDTRADTSAYTSGGIPETLDQPTTITSYYLHRRNAASTTPSVFPIIIDGSNELQSMSSSTIDSVLGAWLRYWAAASDDGYKITYTMATSGGNTRGTAMVDTRLNGSGNYQTRQVGDDYRSQEFPNGSPATITTTNLRIAKA
tara:strand:- start:4278 stop:5225 length:948 start_codon:yes stop_codon:yes gene_type:complete